MPARQRREAWVFLRSRTGSDARGARIELVELGVTRYAGPDGGGGGPYVWAVFPETPHGDYTVRVTYPSGLQQTARLIVDAVRHSVTLDERVANSE